MLGHAFLPVRGWRTCLRCHVVRREALRSFRISVNRERLTEQADRTGLARIFSFESQAALRSVRAALPGAVPYGRLRQVELPAALA
jgi:hypothetical protein